MADFCSQGRASVRTASVVVAAVRPAAAAPGERGKDDGRRTSRVGTKGGGRLTLVVVDDVAQVVAAAVVGLAHAHRVMGEVDIAVIACEDLC